MKHKMVLCICEGAVCVALAVVLSLPPFKIPIGLAFGGFGGSIDLVMIPLIVFAVRWGLGWGLGASLIFGTIKYFLGGHNDISWVSCVARFIVHYISGVTVYAQYMPEEFMNITHMTPALYSLLYNSTYMLPNTILAVVVCALLIVPMKAIMKKFPSV